MISKQKPSLKTDERNFPGSLVVKNLLFNEGDTVSVPGGGNKMLDVSGQLSPCPETAEPAHFGARAAQRRNTLQERSHVPQLKPDTAKNNYF